MKRRTKRRQAPSVILWSKREQLRHSEAVEKLCSLVTDLVVDLANLKLQIDRLKTVEPKRARKSARIGDPPFITDAGIVPIVAEGGAP